MKFTRILMGMPVTVEIIDDNAKTADIEKVFSYFTYVDETFSTYKPASEISKINQGLIKAGDYSADMKEVFKLSEETKKTTNGYFDIHTPKGDIDPSGLVKGWAINNAAKILAESGFTNFYVEAGGDVQTSGNNPEDKPWSIGIKNPFNQTQIVKVLFLSGQGIATSGTYIRGQHIYDPHHLQLTINDIASLTVIGPNVYEADRFATAAFAMGNRGISFVEELPGLEGYMINNEGIATMTSGLENYSNYSN